MGRRYSKWSTAAYSWFSSYRAMLASGASGGSATVAARHVIIATVWTLLTLLIAIIWWSKRRSRRHEDNSSLRDNHGGAAARGNALPWGFGLGPPGRGGVGGHAAGGLGSSSSVSNGAQSGRGGPSSPSRHRPKVSISLDNILFRKAPECQNDSQKIPPQDASTPPLTAVGEVIDRSVAPFLALCEMTNVFPICRVDSDEEELKIRQELDKIGAFDRGLRQHRVLFSSTTLGRASMVRQLQPISHIESNLEVLNTLRNKVHNLVHVKLNTSDASGNDDNGSLTDKNREKGGDHTPTQQSTPRSSPVSNDRCGQQTATTGQPDFTDLQDCVEVLREICKLDEVAELS